MKSQTLARPSRTRTFGNDGSTLTIEQEMARDIAAVKRALTRALDNRPFVACRSALVYEVDSSKNDGAFYTVTLSPTGNIWHASCGCKGFEYGLLCFHIAAATLIHARHVEEGQVCSEHLDRAAVKDGLCQDCINDREECWLEGFKAPSGPATATSPASNGPTCKDCGCEIKAANAGWMGRCKPCATRKAERDNDDLFGAA